MTKKTRIGGIDEIFKSTEPNTPEEKKNIEIEETSRINFDAPETLKQRLQIYCIQNKISIKKFIINAITEQLDKKTQ